jgi:hypothetical protein
MAGSYGFEDSPYAVLDLDPRGIAMTLIVAGVGDGLAILGQRLVWAK